LGSSGSTRWAIRASSQPRVEPPHARREADRQKAAEAVEALTTSEGWQAWLRLRRRRHFRRYSIIA
jgi:hypothetical protein